jgi:hypothetical protein
MDHNKRKEIARLVQEIESVFDKVQKMHTTEVDEDTAQHLEDCSTQLHYALVSIKTASGVYENLE